MKNYFAPTTIVEDFFENPINVVNFAHSLNYRYDDTYRWPGQRTNCISSIDVNFYNYVMHKILSNTVDYNKTFEYKATLYFQKVPSSYGSGWIHRDERVLRSTIIFLNQEEIPQCGTTIYEPNHEWVGACFGSEKVDSYKNFVDNDAYKESTEDVYYREESNKNFKPSIVVSNKFNRMVSFDGYLYHGASNFDQKLTEDRITLVCFLHNFKYTEADATPLDMIPINKYLAGQPRFVPDLGNNV